MAYDYSVIATKTVALVKKFGRTVTLVKYDTAIDDTAKPWRGTSDPRANATEVSTDGISVPPSSATQLGITIITEDLAKRLESIFIVAAGTTDLRDYDEIVDGNTRWKIEISDKLAPGDTTLLYFFGVKR